MRARRTPAYARGKLLSPTHIIPFFSSFLHRCNRIVLDKGEHRGSSKASTKFQGY